MCVCVYTNSFLEEAGAGDWEAYSAFVLACARTRDVEKGVQVCMCVCICVGVGVGANV